jgi:glycosidase
VRYGDGVHNDAIAKLMAAMLLTIRGTPLMYYGEELGAENNDPKRVEDVYDPIGKIGWPKEKVAMVSARRCSGTLVNMQVLAQLSPG